MAKKIQYADQFQPRFGVPYVPVLPLEKLQAMDDATLRAYEAARTEQEFAAEVNPIARGWTLPSWEKVMDLYRKYNVIVLLGGNQSGKTTLGSRMTVWAAATIPEAEVYAWHINERRSIDDQQRFVWEALPQSIKNMPAKRGQNLSLTYTQKNGFTDGQCIFPPHAGYSRGGSIKFYTFQAYMQNDQLIEGVKGHFVWLDERVPLGLFETLRGRIFTYHGRILLTYTVIDGWNDTVERILAKTRTLESKYIPRLKQEVPVVQESLSMDSTAIVYAHTDDNPWTDAKEFWKLWGGESKQVILARGFGVPTKSITSVFTRFSREVNVVKHEDIPFIKNPEQHPVTHYFGLDPGGSKPWVAVWVAVDATDTWWVWAEFPDAGDWALPGNKPGPAQEGNGWGIHQYVDLFRDVEKGVEVFERLIDPRGGAATKQGEEGAVSIITDLDDAGLLPPVRPAPVTRNSSGAEIEVGLQLINNKLFFDPSKPRDSVNSPKLFISDRCQNLAYSMSEYTAKLGPTEATKDFIDALRMIAVANPIFVEPGMDRPSSTGVY